MEECIYLMVCRMERFEEFCMINSFYGHIIKNEIRRGKVAKLDANGIRWMDKYRRVIYNQYNKTGLLIGLPIKREPPAT